MIEAENGLFLARAVSGGVSVSPIVVDTGAVRDSYKVPGVGVLIEAERGWFLARAANGGASVEPVRGSDTGRVFRVVELPGAGMLMGAVNGLFVLVSVPLSIAQVDLRDRENFVGSTLDPQQREFNFVFTVAHACAPVADRLNLKVHITVPGGSRQNRQPQSVAAGDIAEVAMPLRIDSAGQWSFQLISTLGGIERPVGELQTLTFFSPVVGSWWERWWELLASAIAGLLMSANLGLFLFARHSPWAWRLATDDGWGTGLLRIATLLLSHFTKAQLWILDLYFQRVRTHLESRRPFLPIPLANADGTLRMSTEAVAPPWTGRRLWVQGGSGMGKTMLFRTITESHFRDHDSAFAAYAKWGCVVVAFSAREFAGSGEDKDDPAWVVDAVRATLSSQGLTFASGTLLSRFLECGTIGVAIDGLNEVDRTRSVAAFSKTFKDAPMLVTSQQVGADRFIAFRLPADIRAFTFDLLRLYLTAPAAEALFERISASGLKDAIRSGHDVRLIIDLGRADPYHAVLPGDRLGLYAAVIDAGWPEAPEEARLEQQSRTAAAAWRMVSERKPNEEMRRLKPDFDLEADLLVALAEAPESEKKPVRLLRRVGGDAFEFVHDQMHACLAARWFAQDGFSVAELEKMVAGSTIWTQAPDARRTLWGFAAALLDDERLIALWSRIEDKEDWDVLRRALKAEAERRQLEPILPTAA